MTTEAVQVNNMKLSDARAQLLLTQRGLAQKANVSPTVVSNAENGYPIRRLSAHAIFNALNDERSARNLPPLGFKQIEWKISGEEDEEK
ncbi:MAG: helix-turn-helix domain-containing protein [Ktedonobacteraceae bacterium]